MHDFGSRYRRLLKALERRKLDGIIIMHPPNLSYLFNFSGSSGLALCVDGETRLWVDSRYIEQAQSESVHCSPLLMRSSAEETLKRALRQRPKKRIAFEAKRLSHHSFLHIQEVQTRSPGLQLVPTLDIVEDLRLIKQGTEIMLLREAFEIAQKAFRRFKETIKGGRTELDVAAALELEFRCAGADGPAFETIVASGRRSSLPHARASRKKLERAEFVLIDFGVRYRGYHSDLTRIHGLPRARLPAIHDVVRGAQEKALRAVRPGASSSEIDRAARSYIAAKGYRDYFGHSTGHGLGLELHELPAISPRRPREIREGMVFTIEPGIYLPGQYGIRLEDAVLVTKNGCELLSDPEPRRHGGHGGKKP